MWEAARDCRLAAVRPLETRGAGFALLSAAQTGIWFTNRLPEQRHLASQILPNGSGMAAGDVDGDGWCDLYFCGLKDSDNQLYRNLGGWRFADIAREAGVACAGLDATGATFADLEGDGDLDLVVNSIGGGVQLFFNDGKARFTRAPITLNPNRGGTSLGLADADGDGDLDLYIGNYRAATLTDAPGTRFGVKMIQGKPVVTLINGRPLTDPEWTNRFRFKIQLGPGGLGKYSVEEFGEADLYCVNDGRGRFTPVPFASGTFLDDQGRPLEAPHLDWALSVLFRDLNGDGAPDIYVCNDFSTPDRLWLNEGHGRFRLAPLVALRQTSLASMAVDAADLDRDGQDDLVLLDMLSLDHVRRLTQRNIMRAELAPAEDIRGRPQYPRNTVFWNRGDGTYAEIAQYAGLEASEWSWNPILLDVDLDGYEDLLVPNGFVRDNMNMDAMNRIAAHKAGRRLPPLEELGLRAFYPPLNTSNLVFRNLGNLKFTECGGEWGFDQPTISQGACLADFDNDGDLDLAVNNLNHVAGVYRNVASAPRVGVRLRGQPPNTGGIGARITVTSASLTQHQDIVCGGRYCSNDQAQRTFAVPGGAPVEVRVRWRRGFETVIPDIPPNRLVEVLEPPLETGGTSRVSPPGSAAESSPAPESTGRDGFGSTELAEVHPVPDIADPAKPVPTAFRFEDVSQRLGHHHQDDPFDDLERQPLLPRQLSQLGPGVAWWDLDGDGREDLVVGTGRGGRLAGFRNLGDGAFERWTGAPWDVSLPRDVAGFAGWAPGVCLLATANYEDGMTHQPGVVEVARTGATAVLPSGEGSFGPLAVADWDGDGDLDVFVGARAVGGRYPIAAASQLYRQTAGTLELDRSSLKGLPPALVSSAIWTDLTGDGWPELVLACDWGPLRVFRNDHGRLQSWDPPIVWPSGDPALPHLTALSHLTGWWNGVAAGDFDNDGRLDLVAANWGANTRYERWRPRPLRIDFGDFNQNGTIVILENHYAPPLKAYAPDRMLDTVARALPQLNERFPSHQAWAEASIDTVLGPWRSSARRLEAAWLESALLLNRGDHFDVQALPPEAQFTPAFALCVGDADGDGNEDLFLSQNFFDVDMDTSRYDAGRGLWLRGDGRGRLRPVRGQDCGVRVYGEQRGAALADFDGDGRVDFVVTQNSSETKLFRNLGARPGLRVRLEGAPGNPFGVGAVLRLRFAESSGPAREIRAGNGYWSQDGPVQVLATPAPPAAIQIRWPGGRVTDSPIPAGAREIRVRANGELEVTGL